MIGREHLLKEPCVSLPSPSFFQGRNPGALVFVPKSSTPQSAGSAGLTHSASTPSFSSYNSMNSAGLGGNVTASPQTLAQGKYTNTVMLKLVIQILRLIR